MMIIGCDYHPSFQQIAFVDTETGELQERRLEHREEAEKFYRDQADQGKKVRVGMEASGQDCLGRIMIHSNGAISYFGFYYFQQFGESASRSKLTQMA
jgi:hypothetical protein